MTRTITRHLTCTLTFLIPLTRYLISVLTITLNLDRHLILALASAVAYNEFRKLILALPLALTLAFALALSLTLTLLCRPCLVGCAGLGGLVGPGFV